MKLTKVVLLLILFSSVSGCVYSHRPRVVYTPTTPIAVAPTSERQVVRVYPEATTTVIAPAGVPSTSTIPAPAARVSSADLGTANTIRKMFETDSDLTSTARNVRISVLNGRVTMTGFVRTDDDRSALNRALSTTPGVSSVDDQIRVELNR